MKTIKMKKITIEISEETEQALKTLVQNANEHVDRNEDYCSHGKLTTKTLLTMLAEDAAQVETRPGSWEGTNMATVLSSHGYY